MADKSLLNGHTPNGQIVVISANGDQSAIKKLTNGDCDLNKYQINGVNNKTSHDDQHSLPNGGIIEEKSYELQEPPDGGARAWFVMISAFLCNGVIFGVINTYGVIHSYLQKQLAEQSDSEASSKAALVGSLTIGATFLFSPVAGVLTDKIGLRRTIFIGGVLSAGGMLLSSFFTHSIEALYLTYGVMFGIGAALSYTPTLAILGHYFKRYLGKVSGFVTAGSSVFTAIMPPGLDYLLKDYGLSVTLQVMAGISCFIIMCAFVYKPLHPPPPPPKVKPGRSPINTFMRSMVNVDIWKKKRYVIWSLSVPLALFGYFVPYVHMVKFVQNKFPDNNQNWPVMCVGIASGVGRLIFGVIADLPRVNRVLLQQLSLMCIGLLTMLLPVTSSYILLLVITLIMGLFDGCFITLIGPISFEMCGARGATQAIGFLLGLSSLPLTVGPPIAGKIFDSTGSYTLPLILAGIPPLIGANLIFLTRCVRNESRRESTLRDGTDIPLAKSAWNSDNPENGIVANGKCHPDKNERNASLATAESLTDVKANGTI